MSTKCRAWLLGATVGIVTTGCINHVFIAKPQSDMLLSLRHALMTPERIMDLKKQDLEQPRQVPFFSRHTLNQVLIAMSDKFIFDNESSDKGV